MARREGQSMRRLMILIVAVLISCSLMVSTADAATPTRKTAIQRKSGCKVKCRTVCPTTKRAVRRAPVRKGAGPVCPAPVVNVPQQPAPVVNVPQQAPPVVNVAAPPPGVGITTDECYIYVVKGDELMVIDKKTMCVVKRSSLSTSSGSSPPD